MSASLFGFADVANASWKAGDGRCYSAAANAMLATAPPGALTWPADASGNETAAALYAILQPYGLGDYLDPTPTPARLISYANAKQIALRDGGITVNVGDATTPDDVNVASDANGRTLVTGCVQLVGLAASNSQPAPTFPWINNGGTQLTLTAAQMMTIGYKLGAFVQATYATLGAVLAAIAAGTITTFAEIDAPPAAVAAWPATSY